jgi:hypothetical protein
MLAVGGLKAAAKRTVFGDVSNTAKAVSSTRDDSGVVSKAINPDIVKPLAIQKESAPAAFLRPAQRPLNNSSRSVINNNPTSQSESTIQTKIPLADSRQSQLPAQLANKGTQSKRGNKIFKDDADNEQQNQTLKQDPEPALPVHQNLAPRQIKSQPQLKQDPPILRRTQSKHISCEPSGNIILNDPACQEVAEAHVLDPSVEPYQYYMRLADEKREDIVQEGVKIVTVERSHRQLPAPPVSEPEEYWEEEEEEVYDDQGYTTAHSYPSRGDNTTGGATTVLFPKVTNKVKKEIAAAKEMVESARSAEDIEDDLWDTSMVAEYGDEIFAYMRELEVCLRFFIQSSNSLICWLVLTRSPERASSWPSLRPLMQSSITQVPCSIYPLY